MLLSLAFSEYILLSNVKQKKILVPDLTTSKGYNTIELDCEQSLFCSKIRRETRKEELKTTSACQNNMRSCEPYVVRASEDELGRPRYLRLAASLLAARMSGMPSHAFSLWIFEQKRDCSQSTIEPRYIY